MNANSFIDCRFVLGSVAMCESLFSKAKVTFKQNQEHKSPLQLETIIFLKENVSYWGVSSVAEAMSERSSNRIRASETGKDDD